MNGQSVSFVVACLMK